ncbi:ATP-dependent RNA helicase DHX33-like [Sycon ciliatum]|uniref:ATP-dependent RNA helicase DHX33-like n=1 Tax=Sycon ciliatum TaxID=27933 RepID=UPI0020AC24DB|eukprot:scpid31904/ scgid33952/ Putative ATP-dependent RNA helicase DHX33; DEAH box protein 33
MSAKTGFSPKAKRRKYSEPPNGTESPSGSSSSKSSSHGASPASIAEQRQSLPIYSGRKPLIKAFHQHRSMVVIGETASGKTTQIPQYLHECGLTARGAVACTQPRRIAATTVAQRVADEMGVKLGEEVGYSVRFDDCSTSKTKIRFMTDGMLLREAIVDPLLKRYSVIVLDEAHERTLHTDILFGVIKQAQKQRVKSSHACLKIIVMSATLDADQFSLYFDSAPVLYIQGRQYPVRMLYTAEPQQNYLRTCVVTVMQLHRDPEIQGDLLMFLTGQDEIETMCRLLAECVEELERQMAAGECEEYDKLIICPLYAALPPAGQAVAFEPTPAGSRKVIVSTNIAETSVTIPGIRHVIDPGLVKLKVFDQRGGMEVLRVTPVSKAQARQRSGRAGREASGRCYRLFTEESFGELEECTIPEVRRCNLTGVVLQLLALGITDIVNFDFMDPPPKEFLKHALETLLVLSAVAKTMKLQLTPMGENMAHFPLDPKLAKIILKASEFQCGDEILTIVAMLTVESVLYTPPGQRDSAGSAWKKFHSPDGDHLMLLSIFRAYRKVQGNRAWCRENFVNGRNVKKAVAVRKQLRELCERQGIELKSCGQKLDAVRQCLTHGLFMNTAELQPSGQYLSTQTRKPVFIHPSSCLFHAKPAPPFLLYSELVLTTKNYMRNVCIIDKAWLKEACPLLFS